MDNKAIRFVIEVLKGNSVRNLNEVSEATARASGAVTDLTLATDAATGATKTNQKANVSAAQTQRQAASASQSYAAKLKAQAAANQAAAKTATQAATQTRMVADATFSGMGATEAYNKALLDNARALRVVQDQQFLTEKGLQRFANRQADANIAIQAANNNLGQFYTTLGKLESMGTPAVMRAATWSAIGVGGVAYKSVKMYTELNSQMQQVINQAGRPAGELNWLTNTTLDIANKTGATIHDVANAMYRAASGTASWHKGLGATKKELKNLTRAMVDFNVLGNVPSGAQSEQGARILVSLMNANIGKYSQNPRAAAAFVNAVVGAGDIRASEAIAASGKGLFTAAKLNNIDLPSIFAYVDLLTSMGQTGQTAGTYVKSASTLLGQNTSMQGTKALAMIGIAPGMMQNWIREKGLGFAVQQLIQHMGKFQPLANFPRYAGLEGNAAAEKLFNVWTVNNAPKGFMEHWKAGKLSENEKKFITGQILTKAYGGSKQMIGVATLLQNPEKFLEFYNRIVSQSTPEVAGAAIKRAENAPGRQLQRLLNEFQTVMIDIGKKITPTVIKAGHWLLKLVEGLTKFKEILIPLVSMMGTIMLMGGASKIAQFGRGVMQTAGWSATVSMNVLEKLGLHGVRQDVYRRNYKRINAYESLGYRSTSKSGENFLSYAPGAWQNPQGFWTRDLTQYGGDPVMGPYPGGGGGSSRPYGGGGGGGGAPGGGYGGGYGGVPYGPVPYGGGGRRGRRGRWSSGVNTVVPYGNYRGHYVGAPGSLIMGGGAGYAFNDLPNDPAHFNELKLRGPVMGAEVMGRRTYNLVTAAQRNPNAWRTQVVGAPKGTLSPSPTKKWLRATTGIKDAALINQMHHDLSLLYDNGALIPEVAARMDWLNTTVPVTTGTGRTIKRRLGNLGPRSRHAYYTNYFNSLSRDDQDILRSREQSDWSSMGPNFRYYPKMPNGERIPSPAGFLSGLLKLIKSGTSTGLDIVLGQNNLGRRIKNADIAKEGLTNIGTSLLEKGSSLASGLLGFLGGPIGMTLMTSLLPLAITKMMPVIKNFLTPPKPPKAAPHTLEGNRKEIKNLTNKITGIQSRIQAGTATSQDFEDLVNYNNRINALQGENTGFIGDPTLVATKALSGIRALRGAKDPFKNLFNNGADMNAHKKWKKTWDTLPADVKKGLGVMGVHRWGISSNANYGDVLKYLNTTESGYNTLIESPAFRSALNAVDPLRATKIGFRNLGTSQLNQYRSSLDIINKGRYWTGLNPGQAKQRYFEFETGAFKAQADYKAMMAASNAKGLTEDQKRHYIELAGMALQRSQKLAEAATKVAQENHIRERDARAIAQHVGNAFEATLKRLGVTKNDFTDAFSAGIRGGGLAAIINAQNNNKLAH